MLAPLSFMAKRDTFWEWVEVAGPMLAALALWIVGAALASFCDDVGLGWRFSSLAIP